MVTRGQVTPIGPEELQSVGRSIREPNDRADKAKYDRPTEMKTSAMMRGNGASSPTGRHRG
jgi:hypothetical protein